MPRDRMEVLFRPAADLPREVPLGLPHVRARLYLAREIAQAHAGDLVVRAHRRRGTSFLVTLPAG